ncbi:ubiquitin DRF-UBI, partial [Auricularia subglabra TFB-10046 SS5]
LVMTASGRSTVLCMSASDTVLHIKQQLESRAGIPPDQSRLIFAGKELEDERTLDDYAIIENCTVHHVRRLRG